MDAIVAVDSNWAIGRAGGMLFHLPKDLQYFKRMTLGKTLVMGRATLDSLPGGRPLPGRSSIVLTRDRAFCRQGAQAAHSLNELSDLIDSLPPEQVMLIGRGNYHALIDCCHTAYVTRVEPARRRRIPGFPGWMNARAGRWDSRAHSGRQGLRHRVFTYRNRIPAARRFQRNYRKLIYEPGFIKEPGFYSGDANSCAAGITCRSYSPVTGSACR